MRSFVCKYLVFFSGLFEDLDWPYTWYDNNVMYVAGILEKMVYIIIKDLKNSKAMLIMCLTKHSGYHLEQIQSLPSWGYMYRKKIKDQSCSIIYWICNSNIKLFLFIENRKKSTPKKRKVLTLQPSDQDKEERKTAFSATMTRLLERFKALDGCVVDRANETLPNLVSL